MTWTAAQERSRLVLAVTLGLFAAYAGLYFWFQLGPASRQGAGDFFALWSYGQILRAEGWAAVYDPVRLHALQMALGMPGADHNPFPYPPTFLLAVWPLGFMPFETAWVAWVGVTLVLFLAAATQFRPVPAIVALLAPVTTLGVISGQSGFLSGALLLGGMQLAAVRPWWGGVLIGLLTFKPQLGILIPVALVAASAWRCVAGAGLTVVALLAVTGFVFGAGAWGVWLRELPGYAGSFETGSMRYELMPTVVANLKMLGAPRGMANGVQAVVAVAAGVLVWRAFRPGVTRPAIAVLAAATFLATPHAFIYDMPMVAGGLLLFVAARLRTGGLRGREVMASLLALVTPALMLWLPGVPVSTVALALVVAALLPGQAVADVASSRGTEHV